VIGDLVAAGAGSVTAIGLPSSHIRISNAVFNAPGRLSYVDAMGTISLAAQDVDHSRIYGGQRPGGVAPTLGVSSSLTDSRASGVYMPTLAGIIERNVLLDCSVAIGGTPDAPWSVTSFANNYVDALHPDSYSGNHPGFSSVNTSGGGAVHGNTFTGLLAGYIRVYAAASPADLSGNYWGTTDAAVIGSYFTLRYFQLDGASTPTVSPALAAADPATPAP
jgi:hypothetical protein